VHDRSRVFQYYARDYQAAWDFFKSLATNPSNADSLPNPYLASGVEAVGTPGVVYVDGQTHVFARGSNNSMYWKNSLSPGGWVSLGCCAGSDPSAVQTGTGPQRGGDFGEQRRTRHYQAQQFVGAVPGADRALWRLPRSSLFR
jgi:hypothetical protein